MASIPTAHFSTSTQAKAYEKNEAMGAAAHRSRDYATVLPARHRGARWISGGARRTPARRLHPRHRWTVDARHLGLRRHARAGRQTRHQGHADGPARQRRRAAHARARARRTAGRAGEGPSGATRHRLRAHSRVRQGDRRSDSQRDRRADQGRRHRLVIIDLRGTAFGDVEIGLAAARLFVPNGTLAFRQERGKAKEPIAAAAGDGSITVRRRCSPTTAPRAPPNSSRRRSLATSAPRSSASGRSAAPHASALCDCPMAAA